MLVSLYVLAYNHQAFIADAIRGALAQDYTPLEIVISDDRSTDDTWEIIQREVADYRGPHRVRTRRNERNLGIAAHINALWRECKGEWIVASAGDDVSLPVRVSRTLAAAREMPGTMLVQTWLTEVDEVARPISVNRLDVPLAEHSMKSFGLRERQAGTSFHPHGAAMAYSRRLIDEFGPLPTDLIFEDNVVNVRAELLGSTLLVADPLVLHRNHAGQITRLDDAANRERRFRVRLQSDASSTLQNELDLRHAQPWLDPTMVAELRRSFRRLSRLCGMKKHAFLDPWPARLLYVPWAYALAMRHPVLRRENWSRALLPTRLYSALKRLAARRRKPAPE